MESMEEIVQKGNIPSGFLARAKLLFMNRHARRFARKTRRAIRKSMSGLGQEARETRDMARLFFRMLENKLNLENRNTPPTPEEVKEAIEQLKDIGRISIFASISLIPGGGFSLIGLELLARQFGYRKFTLVPSSFQKKNRRFKTRSYGIKEKPLLPEEVQSESTT